MNDFHQAADKGDEKRTKQPQVPTKSPNAPKYPDIKTKKVLGSKPEKESTRSPRPEGGYTQR